MADTRDNAGEENSAIFMNNVSNIGSLNINTSGQVTNIQGSQYNYNNSTTIPKAKNQTNDENKQQNYDEFSGRKQSQNGIFLFILMNYHFYEKYTQFGGSLSLYNIHLCCI